MNMEARDNARNSKPESWEKKIKVHGDDHIDRPPCDGRINKKQGQMTMLIFSLLLEDKATMPNLMAHIQFL